MNRYVEAMARVLKRLDTSNLFHEDEEVITDGRNLGICWKLYVDDAQYVLAALIAELRVDPIAADLLAAGTISHTGAALLARLCDYLAGP